MTANGATPTNSTIDARRAPQIVEHIDGIVKTLNERKADIERALFDIDIEIGALSRTRDFITSGGVDKYERCSACGDPYFCHGKTACSGEPHSDGCDCSLAKFTPGGKP